MLSKENKTKRVLAINDLSCGGRISLSVIMPVLSAMGVEVYPLPTALLSTHTAYKEAYCKTLSREMMDITKHWKKLNLKFDAIYCGFLGEEEQIGIVREIITLFRKENTFLLIDPCMADNGKLYKTYNQNIANGVAKLCCGADLIVPNLTEACFLSKIDYNAFEYSKKNITLIFEKLLGLGCKNALITGIKSKNNTLISGLYKENKLFIYQEDYVNESFFGSGDMFSSVMLGGILNGLDMEKSIGLALKFMKRVIKESVKSKRSSEFLDLKFENQLCFLADEIKKQAL